ncbi:MAG TPA: ATP-binding cassette domain-containing protein [Sulfurimonas sp.]|nr:ATP-binding cassette domain-containing protein [Sulfurimonas sp.]
MNLLKIENLDFGYSKDALLYKDFSLELKKGEIKTIVGPSGSGKSTLFELIVGNLKPFAGSIKAGHISQVFQDPYSSFHNSYSLINQIKDVASLDGLDGFLEEMGLEGSLLEKKPFELSGGQLQRASIVRALLMRPELLLLDEPTSALDNVIQLDVMRLLLKHLDTVAMLLITHELELAQWCSDEIIEL